MLDTEGKKAIYDIVTKLKQQGYTIIYITNAIDEILLADRVIVIKNKQIEREFFKKDILENIDALRELGIELPGIVQIAEKLKEKGINLNLKEFTLDELIQNILQIL